LPLNDPFDNVFASRHRLLFYDEREGHVDDHFLGMRRPRAESKESHGQRP
jgi:hypothetical protein